VVDNPNGPLEGDAYLNAGQESNYRLLENLAKQEIFPFIF